MASIELLKTIEFRNEWIPFFRSRSTRRPGFARKVAGWNCTEAHCVCQHCGQKGRANFAPFSYFNVFSANPPIVIFSPARRMRGNTTKHTLENVLEVPEVVINLVDFAMVHACSLASGDFPAGVSEFEKAGLTSLPSDLVRPLRVAESPCAIGM